MKFIKKDEFCSLGRNYCRMTNKVLVTGICRRFLNVSCVASALGSLKFAVVWQRVRSCQDVKCPRGGDANNYFLENDTLGRILYSSPEIRYRDKRIHVYTKICVA